MFTDPNFKAELKSDGVMVAAIDMPGRSMNVFSADMMDSLENLIDEVEQNPDIRALVITSAKSTFLAGADLSMIKEFTERAAIDTDDELHDLCGRLGRLFLRLEQVEKPTVAALNGLALGGGLELALACHQRVAVDDDRAVLGLPEVKLGLLPGAGGTQRLPRLVGNEDAIKMLLTGQPVHPQKAYRIGLVDRVVPSDELIPEARKLALAPVRTMANWYSDVFRAEKIHVDNGSQNPYHTIYENLDIQPDTYSHYPAYDAIMACVTKGLPMPMVEAISWEMCVFVQLIKDRVAANMVRTLFLDRQRAQKLAAGAESPMKRIAITGNSDASRLIRQLEKARFEIITVDELCNEDLQLVTDGETANRGIQVRLISASSTPLVEGEVGLWLSPKTADGQSAEIFCNGTPKDNRAFNAALKVASRLGAAPLLTQHTHPLMPTLAEAVQSAVQVDDSLKRAAQIASDYVETSTVADPDFVDVACVLAGLFPAWSGGPFKYLAQKQ
ncbi:enoyl-CoA hydratase-related protein [Marinobacter sp. NP-6]|uniref:enoyl-CoA hydratase-related protein n=1 Tax=Marinobacter sp. NP-6 TaxID=2488666 RepID=UPI00163BAEB9|nr:enoyl-CoA hydratase-related protein [Marinobacter sp. NP-6]